MSSATQTDRTAGEADWPAWADRTPPGERTQTAKYSLTQHQAIKRLETELEDRLGVDDWRLSTAAPHRKRDGMPYADANPRRQSPLGTQTVDEIPEEVFEKYDPGNVTAVVYTKDRSEKLGRCHVLGEETITQEVLVED